MHTSHNFQRSARVKITNRLSPHVNTYERTNCTRTHILVKNKCVMRNAERYQMGPSAFVEHDLAIFPWEWGTAEGLLSLGSYDSANFKLTFNTSGIFKDCKCGILLYRTNSRGIRSVHSVLRWLALCHCIALNEAAFNFQFLISP